MLQGRESDLARLRGLLAQARSRAGAAVVIRGEPGIGKTSLLDALADEAAAGGVTVLRARPLQTESRLPFGALGDLLRPVLPLLDRLPAPQAAALAGSLALGPAAPGDRFAAAAATLGLLGAAADRGPVLALVDDAHWLDTASRDAIVFAGRRLADEAIVLVLAARDRPWLDRVGLPQWELRGIDAAAARDLLAAAGRRAAPGVVDRLVAETGGNPLALQEAAAGLDEGELAGATPLHRPVRVGRRLEDGFAGRLRRLPATTRTALVVAAASATDDAAEIGRAAAVLGLPPAALEPAEREGHVTLEAGTVRFRHPLVRAAAYQVADPAQRRAAHRALAAAVGEAHPDRAAWHLAGASAGPDEPVAAALEAAAVAAHARSAYETAADAYQLAARLSPSPVDGVRRSILAGNALRLAGLPEAADASLAAVEDAVPDPLLRSDIARLRIGAVMFARPLDETIARAIAEADRIEPDDPVRAAAFLAFAAFGSLGTASAAAATAASERAFALASAAPDPDRTQAAVARANAHALRGDVRAARAVLEPYLGRLLAVDPLGEETFILVAAAHLLSWIEDEAAAETLLDRLVGAARRVAALTLLPYALAVASELDRWRGRTALALSAAEEGLAIGLDTGQEIHAAQCRVMAAAAHAVLGNEAACREHAAASIEVGRRVHMGAIETYAEAALGLLELGLGRPDAALPRLEACARLEDAHGVALPAIVRWRGDLVEAYVRLDRREDAARALERLAAEAERAGSRWGGAVVARSRGLLAGPDAYEGALQAALELLDGTDPLERGRTLLALGARRRRDRRRAAARRALREALAVFEAIDAAPWAEQARAELRAAGEVPAARRGGDLGSLTPQELQVAAAVARGATNKEAAAALFISPKTVESHLARIYAKLEIRSRSQLVRRIEGLG